MKTISEQIKDLQATRAAKAARMTEVMQKSLDEGRSTDAAEAEEFDELEAEIKTIDSDLNRLKKLEQMNAQSAKPVERVDTETKGSTTRGNAAPAIITTPRNADDQFKGQSYVRLVIAKALAHIDGVNPVHVAVRRGWDKTNPMLVEMLKAGVAGGGTGSGEWGVELAEADSRYTGDFVEYLTEATIFDKLALREVPANVVIKGQDGIGTGYWVGESKPIPASAMDFNSVELKYKKVAALAVVSNELLRESSPAAEALVRDALVKASAQRIDTTFLSDAAASAGVSPAGMLNGLSAISSSGVGGNGLVNDIAALKAVFIAALNSGNLNFVMNKSLASQISLLRNDLGQWEFPTINEDGGTLVGTPVVTGDNVNAAHLILLKPGDIWKIGDRGVQVSISRDATIEQDSAPTGASDTPVAQSATPVSMFQTESTAFKIVRPMDFAKRRASAVAYVGDADYAPVSSSS